MAPAEAAPAAEALPDRCARCGAPLEPDQEWCVDCGAARTVVHRPPDPRIGLAIVAGLALAVLAVVVALVIAAGDGSGSASRATAPATGRRANGADLAGWPVGLSGWTVVLGRSPGRSAAVALARRLAGSGIATGVLDSTQHPHLQPGYFVVFSGRYPDAASARAAAAALRIRGQPQALAREVARPGGL